MAVYTIENCACCQPCDCGCNLSIPAEGLEVILEITGPNAGSYGGTIFKGEINEECCYYGDFGIIDGMGPIDDGMGGDNGASCEVTASVCCFDGEGWRLTINVANVSSIPDPPCSASETNTATVTDCDPLAVTWGSFSIDCPDCNGSPWTATGATMSLPTPFAFTQKKIIAQADAPTPQKKPCGCKKDRPVVKKLRPAA